MTGGLDQTNYIIYSYTFEKLIIFYFDKMVVQLQNHCQFSKFRLNCIQRNCSPLSRNLRHKRTDSWIDIGYRKHRLRICR